MNEPNATHSDGTSGFSWRRNAVSSYCLGELKLIDGSAVTLPCFRSAARGEGLNLGGPTPKELKVAALRRYRELVVSS